MNTMTEQPPNGGDTAACKGSAQPSPLSEAAFRRIRLDAIRGEHALLTQNLLAVYPRPGDDALTLTPEAVEMLCTLHPLVVRPVGRRRMQHFEVIGGLLAWQVLRPLWRLQAAQQESDPGRATADHAVAAENAAPPPSTQAPVKRRGRFKVPALTLSGHFRVPALVCHGAEDTDVQTCLLAERWLLITSVGPLQALQHDLQHLYDNAQTQGWINELTPHIRTLSALSRALGVTTPTLRARRRQTMPSPDAEFR